MFTPGKEQWSFR